MKMQYNAIKAEHPDCLLFYRLGDFYEMFDDDAVLGARELNLALTTRDRGKPEDERTPMCGVPYHSAEQYISKLIAKGYKVAVCEQMEDPKLCKGLVSRDIVRIISPGTIMETSMLREGESNYLGAVMLRGKAGGKQRFGIHITDHIAHVRCDPVVLSRFIRVWIAKGVLLPAAALRAKG